MPNHEDKVSVSRCASGPIHNSKTNPESSSSSPHVGSAQSEEMSESARPREGLLWAQGTPTPTGYQPYNHVRVFTMTSAMLVDGEESNVEDARSAAKVSEDLFVLLVSLQEWSTRAEGSHTVEEGEQSRMLSEASHPVCEVLTMTSSSPSSAPTTQWTAGSATDGYVKRQVADLALLQQRRRCCASGAAPKQRHKEVGRDTPELFEEGRLAPRSGLQRSVFAAVE